MAKVLLVVVGKQIGLFVHIEKSKKPMWALGAVFN